MNYLNGRLLALWLVYLLTIGASMLQILSRSFERRRFNSIFEANLDSDTDERLMHKAHFSGHIELCVSVCVCMHNCTCVYILVGIR